MARVCLDYGHGGTDPGAVYKGRKESDDVLAIGREVAKELRLYGIIVDETRTADVTVSLRQRSDFVNKGNYDYFLSFHRNAFKPEKARGAESFVYTSTSKKSLELAEKVQVALVSVGFFNRGVKTANFHVLRETKTPAVLVEMGFIDNSKDNKLFDNKRKEIVEGISKAILAQLEISHSIEDDLKAALAVLVEKGLITTPDYWLENAREGKQVKGKYAAILIKRLVDYLVNLGSEH